MSKRKPTDQHARDRASERYGAKWEDRDCAEVLDLIRRCRWVPLELQETRVVALLKYKDDFYRIVFEATDLALVTTLPFDLTAEQFERARQMFPELASYGVPPQEAPAAVRSAPPVPKPLRPEPSFFDSIVLKRFGQDKKKAGLWWNTPNYELGAKSPSELESGGKLEKVKAYLDRTKRENHALLIPQRKATAKLGCKDCRGYPPTGMVCRCEEAAGS